MVGRGHAPEMICLFNAERNVLIAADQILPKISPNVSVWPSEPEANPLGDFLQLARAFSRAAGRLPGAALARVAVSRLARADRSADRAPRRAPGGDARGLRARRPPSSRSSRTCSIGRSMATSCSSRSARAWRIVNYLVEGRRARAARLDADGRLRVRGGKRTGPGRSTPLSPCPRPSRTGRRATSAAARQGADRRARSRSPRERADDRAAGRPDRSTPDGPLPSVGIHALAPAEQKRCRQKSRGWSPYA